jgi:hypothetical protein
MWLVRTLRANGLSACFYEVRGYSRPAILKRLKQILVA